MTKYFFDFRSGDVVSMDDEGEDLPDADAAHGEALGALADAMPDSVMQGKADQCFAVEVRDEFCPVLKIAVVCGSTILRRQ